MKTRTLGRTGATISEIGFGAWQIGGAWGDVSEEDGKRALNAALDAGVSALKQTARLDLHGGAFASFDHAAWLAAPEELRLRLLGRLIVSYGGQAEPLRLVQLEALADRLADPGFEGVARRHPDPVRLGLPPCPEHLGGQGAVLAGPGVQ